MKLKILDPRIKNNFPKYQTAGAAAFDLAACIDQELILYPRQKATIRTGIAIYIANPNLVGIIAPRSGLGTKQGLILANTIGVIDSDYQGELTVCLFNNSAYARPIIPMQRIAQMMIVPIFKAQFEIVDEFSEPTERGENGFGSTGT